MEIAKGVSFDDQVEVKIFNLEDEDIADVLKEVSKADGVLLGSPTFVGEALKPIWDLATSMTAATFRGRLGSAFGSFGWSGEAVDNLLERLKQMKMKVLPGYKVRFKPSSEELKKAFIFGSEFSKTLLENKGVEKKV
jgi:flavorubredoxin